MKIEAMSSNDNQESIDSSMSATVRFIRPDFIESGTLAEFDLSPLEMSIAASDDTVEVSLNDIINDVMAAFNSNRKLVTTLQKTNVVANALPMVNERVNSVSKYNYNIPETYENNREFKEFIHLVRAGAIVGEGFSDLGSSEKVLLGMPGIEHSTLYKVFNGKPFYSNMPVIASFNRDEVNSALSMKNAGNITASFIKDYYQEALSRTDIIGENIVKAKDFALTYGKSDLDIVASAIKSDDAVQYLTSIKAELEIDRFVKIQKIVKAAI